MTHETPDSIGIELPDLLPDATIRADNIGAMQAVYFAAQLEELGIFQVVDVLARQFLNGALPLDRNGSNQMADFLRDRPNRMTQQERGSLYARAFGAPGGDQADPRLNREFDDLWIRFVSSVEAFVRQIPPDTRPGTELPAQQDMTRAARDLAENLSLHGYGMGHFAASDLQGQIKDVLRLLSSPAMLRAAGTEDMWHLVARVASSDLGSTPNIVRYRTMATSGAVIIRWLADRVPVITSETVNDILDVNTVGDAPSASPMVTPTDRDLVDACQNWLVAAATT